MPLISSIEPPPVDSARNGRVLYDEIVAADMLLVQRGLGRREARERGAGFSVEVAISHEVIASLLVVDP